MPVCNKQQFVPCGPPSDLRPEESLFYCSATKEVFRDYDAFFHRTILCNSLVWSCSITNRGNLTYEEADLSERRAKKRLQAIPVQLKKALIYACYRTRRGKLTDVLDDVYFFVNNRYFVGEEVEACIDNQWVGCEVLSVLPPTQDEIESFKNDDNGEKGKEKSGGKRSFEPHDSLFKYELKRIDDEEEDENKDSEKKREDDKSGKSVVAASNVRRSKGLLTREKVSLFVKYVMEPDQTVYKLKSKLCDRFNLKEMKFVDIFAGQEPIFEETKSTRFLGNKKIAKDEKKANGNKQSTLDAWVSNGETPSSSQKTTKSSSTSKTKKKSAAEMEKEMLRFREEMAKRKEEATRRRLEGIARKKEERKLLNKVMTEWKMKREDLECDDLKPLPQPNSIQCSVPNELIGEFLYLLEFASQFEGLLDTADSFPDNGLDFETLEAAVTSNESNKKDGTNKVVGGALFDVLSFLLVTIFDLQDEEHEEAKLDEYTELSTEELDRILMLYSKDARLTEHIREASEMAKWPLKTQGVRSLRDLYMDQWTITEILRLHLLSTGGFKSAGSERLCTWRYQQRGGFKIGDDPVVAFKSQEPAIMEKLSTQTVYDLSVEERLKLLTCLVHQILTFASVRDEIDERFNNLAEAKAELRSHHISMNKKLKAEKAKAKQKDEKEPETVVNGESKDDSSLTERQRLSLQSQKEREDKERMRREEKAKCEAKLTEEELSDKVNLCQTKAGLFLLGRDRAYRRYWLLSSINAIVVEHDDALVGTCLPQPTIINPNAGPIDTATAMLKVKKLMSESEGHHDEKSSSDKENDTNDRNPASDAQKTYSRQPNAKVLSIHSESINDENKDKKMSNFSPMDSKPLPGVEFQLAPQGCTADPSTCFVHPADNSQQVKWGVFASLEEIDNLIESLSPRGFREAELKTKLQNHRTSLEQHFKRKLHVPWPFSNQNGVVKREQDEAEEKANLRSIIDLTLRDQILELEEKIFLGSLGSLKVNNREVWQSRIQEGTYDPQCDHLYTCNGKEISMDVESKVTELRLAVLQIGQMVEPRFIKSPLGEEEKERRKRLQEEEKKKKEKKEDASTVFAPPYVQWEQSLLECASYPQLFVHLTTLENSIKWSKSLLNAKCRLCRRKTDAEKMLLCDGCDRGHHLYCLKPKLKAIPEGDWFCSDCKPKERIRSPKKKHRRVFSTEDEDVTEEPEQQSDEEIDSQQKSDFEENESDENCDEASQNKNAASSEGEMETDENENSDEDEDEDTLNGTPDSDEDIPLRRKTRANVAPSKNTSANASKSVPKTNSLSHWLTSTRRSAAEASAKIAKISNGKSSKIDSDNEDNKDEDNDDDDENDGRARRTRATMKRGSETISSLRTKKSNGVADTGFGEPSSKRARSSRRKNLDFPSTNYALARNIPKFSPPQLEDLLNLMMKHKDGWPFDRPITKGEAPDYARVIARPMDLGTIRSNLLNMKYNSNEAVLEDIDLVFNNCFLYNREDAEEFQCGVRLQSYYTRIARKMGLL